MARQAVGAEHQQVAFFQYDLVQVDERSLLRADAVKDDVLIRVVNSLFRGQRPFLHQAGDEALVAADLLQLPLAPLVGATVADVADVGVAVLDDGGDHRRGHAAAVVAVGGHTAQVGVSGLHGINEARAPIGAAGGGQIVVERSLTGILAGDLTGVGPTHAVGNDVERAVAAAIILRRRLIDNDEVFIVAAHQTVVGAPGGVKGRGIAHHRHNTTSPPRGKSGNLTIA